VQRLTSPGFRLEMTNGRPEDDSWRPFGSDPASRSPFPCAEMANQTSSTQGQTDKFILISTMALLIIFKYIYNRY
jgi:hypothetical protein